MTSSREWLSARATSLLTFGVGILSIVVGLIHITTGGVEGPLAASVPEFVSQTVGFTGTITGFIVLVGAAALTQGYRIGWYATIVLLPLTAAQGLLQTSAVAYPLVVLSLLAMPVLVYNRNRFNRSFRPTQTQLGASIALVTALAYGTLGTFALREQFRGIGTLSDAFYYTVVTASTVGYGDITATTEIGRLFSLSVLLLNVSAFAIALGVLLTPAIEAQLSKALGKMTDSQFELLEGHVLVLGYGDLTEPILEELETADVQFVVITPEEHHERLFDERDIMVMTANPSDEGPLERAQIESARAVVAATNRDAEDALSILTARQLNPDIRIVAAATQRENIRKLQRAGADEVVSPAAIGGHMLVESALGDIPRAERADEDGENHSLEDHQVDEG